MLTILFYLLIILAGFPVGLLLVRFCREEVKSWRNRFKLIVGVCLVIVGVVAFSSFEYNIQVIVSLLFIIVVGLVIVRS